MVELVDTKVHPLVRPGTVTVQGVAYPVVDGPVPLMLSPGSEYRIREVSGVSEEPLWILERRNIGGA